MRYPRISIILLAALPMLASCRQERSDPPVSHSWEVMSTFASVSVPSGEKSALKEISDISISRFKQIEFDLNPFRSNSVLSIVNQKAGSGVHTHAPDHFASLHEESLKLFTLSGGAFDPTVGPLMRLWGFRNQIPPETPSAESLKLCISQVDYGCVKFTPAPEPSLYLTTPGMRLDYGGIAKGYAVDLAFNGIPPAQANCLINLAGNMRAAGEGRKGVGGWTIAVRDPFNPGNNIGLFMLSNGRAVATSGNYERFVVIDDRRYAHIIDPRDGMPVEGIASVTVIADSAMIADGLSTALFVLGPAESRGLMDAYPTADALFVTDTQPPKFICTQGFADKFIPIDRDQSELKIIQ